MNNMLKVIQIQCKLEIFPFFSRDRDEIFVKLRASEENLRIQADLDDFYLQMKSMPGETFDF